jgi:alkylated DNA repair dioxygenase AlkB
LNQELIDLGLTLVPDFVSDEEQTELIKHLVRNPQKKTTERNSIHRFGSEDPYKGNLVSKKVPEYFNFILDRVMERGLLTVRPDSVSVNEYKTGQQISPHIDSVSSGPVISIVSLLSEATMVFRLKANISHKLILPPRSLVQLRDEIRTKWMHSIEPVKNDRYSIVLRCSTPRK